MAGTPPGPAPLPRPSQWSQVSLARLDTAIWTLIYGGLFALVLGIATGRSHPVAAWSLGAIGVLAAAFGFALIAFRSRLREEPPGASAQSAPSPPRKDP